MNGRQHYQMIMHRIACPHFHRASFQIWVVTAFLFFLAAASEQIAIAQTSSMELSEREIEHKVSNLLARMTLEEKLGQLQQLHGTWEGDCRPELIDLARKGKLGSTLFIRGAKR